MSGIGWFEPLYAEAKKDRTAVFEDGRISKEIAGNGNR